jgi:hypothetical protein
MSQFRGQWRSKQLWLEREEYKKRTAIIGPASPKLKKRSVFPAEVMLTWVYGFGFRCIGFAARAARVDLESRESSRLRMDLIITGCHAEV